MSRLKHPRIRNRVQSVPLTPLQEQLATVRRLRSLCRTGRDAEGNRVNGLAPQILADEERKLGKMFADWCEQTGFAS
jgi:hypothetical protein